MAEPDKEKKTTEGKTKKSTAVKTTMPVEKPERAPRSLPGAAGLKNRFKAGSIPLQSDFADLIDMANIGVSACGLASGQTGPGNGMKISSTGQLEPNARAFSFKDDTAGYSPIVVNTDSNNLVVNLHEGLADTDGGLIVKQGKGIIVDNEGVRVDMAAVIPRGIITMFSGDKIPEGWALCDGKNETPDLHDRFICGTRNLSDIGGRNAKKTIGNNENKKCEQSSSAVKTGVSITVNSTVLTVDQIPNHNHGETGYYYHTSGYSCIKLYNMAPESSYPHYKEPRTGYYTGKTGGGKGHNHTATANQQSHEHVVDVMPPYYILAFIMKT